MDYMIDTVRKTVLTVLNKENRGNLSPEQYNLLAAQAQMNIFNLLHSEYSRLVAMKNGRRLSSEYADMIENLRDTLDNFNAKTLLYPSGYDADVPANSTTAVNEFTPPADMYSPLVFKYSDYVMDKVSQSKYSMLDGSSHTAPSLLYPIYSEVSGKYSVNPFIQQENEVDVWIPITAIYTRFPKTPKWTWMDLSSDGSEEAVFFPNTDFQDFELPSEYAPQLVLEILKLAGVTIKDTETLNSVMGLDTTQYQKENK